MAINYRIASLLKSTCVGIGLKHEDEEKPLTIAGTGFIIDPEGFILTATHVLEGLQKFVARNSEVFTEDIQKKLDFGAFWFVENEGILELKSKKISNIRELGLKSPSEIYHGPKKIDVSVGRIEGKFGDLEFLKIKKPKLFDLYSNVLMCGYPGGDVSFNVSDKDAGYRTTPVVQQGMISCLIPSDYSSFPVGIQTDIISTGGSSGSAIVDGIKGEVIGIAQQVIPAGVLDDNERYLGGAKIGVVWGVTNLLFYGLVKKTIELMKPDFDEFGVLKPGITKKQTDYKITGKLKDGELVE